VKALLAGATLLSFTMPAGAAGLPNLTPAQSDYVEHCSGCHGMQGNSAPAAIPVLRDRVGYFMCSSEGRDYLIRLPKGAKPFSAAEVAALRQQALTTQSLVETRARIVGDLVRSCGVPATMKKFSDGYSDTVQPSR